MRVLTTLEKIQEDQRKTGKKYISGFDDKPTIKTIKSDVNELEQMRMIIQSLVDKVHSLDKFVRDKLGNRVKYNIYESHSEKQNEEVKYIDSNLPVL